MLNMDQDEASKNEAIRARLAGIIRSKGEELEVANLHSGDFAAFDTPLSIGVERKTLPNLISSLASNELDEQLVRLVELYDVPVLLVEDWPTPNPMGKVKIWGAKRREYAYSWITNECASWFGRGVWPMFVPATATAPTIASLYQWAQKGEHRDTYAPKKFMPRLRKQSLTEQIVSCIPGVGPKRAFAFRTMSPDAVDKLTEEEWAALTGSKALAVRAYKAWHTS